MISIPARNGAATIPQAVETICSGDNLVLQLFQYKAHSDYTIYMAAENLITALTDGVKNY
jgi:hypothetical protein